jgi:hypothetical protein
MLSGTLISQNSRMTKPTHNYTIVGNVQLVIVIKFIDVLQHWYYSPLIDFY